MQRLIQLTADGSHTIAIPEMQLTYHSHHGAIQESMQVFIEAGLKPLLASPADTAIRILEIGFGTGLNAILSLREAEQHTRCIEYISTEKYPLTIEEARSVNHGALLQLQEAFLKLHNADWEKPVAISPCFSLLKMHCYLPAPVVTDPVHCIFFDAFAPDVQPELWSQPFFEQLHELLLPGGVLTTYCSKATVRRALSAAGFSVEKIPGPWGKREMVRAYT
ncbi:tRNA (5-methylaminomethyl-2-thiouridine)(34)-methyltransferase MnmD [Sediminibacterium soli]|uniref:tRNA (5-methylaminomethyl-2-thiouridine)(34)-methyltransferase MnmD n=1 Tax=Sediminibacterium soli TaxID=2698829 RepID=UPI00137B591D|nr:tRNA (5-methylaminomethyl-2-thiouridine)(34)-methyltransferase MnmD [Sediminibacterium soli]NCI47585.1 tRNA (5-methylaminomethyl-2-thiouridine)(34)-methyltransferase MnmD [Sediminibacterium soli]